MGILDRLFRRSNEPPVTVIYGQGVYSGYVRGMTPDELYQKQPALRAVVDFLARNVAQVSLKTYIRDGQDRRRDRESVTPKLLDNPCEGITTYQLLERLVTDLKLYNEHLWYVIEDADSPSGWAIHPIPEAWVSSAHTRDGFEPSYYKVANPDTGVTIRIPAADVIRFAGYNPAHPAAVSSPVEALKDVLEEQLNAWEFRNQVWQRGGRTTSYIYRPPGAAWSKDAFDRFKKQWESYSGGGGAAGKTPIFEDGMELRSSTFNAHELAFEEATKLSREDVAAVYHVNPQLIWAGERQTYASAKDNARMLYADTLAPDLKMIEDKINAALLPKIGAAPNVYVEFDLQSKLNGAFEDQAAQLTSAVGTPYMTVAEARARLNLPYIEGTDVIARPLNTAYTDELDADVEGQLSAAPQTKCACCADKDHEEPAFKALGEPTTDDALEIASLMRRFFKRQGKAVVSKLDNPKMRGTKAGGDWPAWWEADRWNKELADDLYTVFLKQAANDAQKLLTEWGVDADEFSVERIEAYIRAMADAKAKATNDVTYRELLRALEGEISEDAEGATPRGVFEKAETDRADMQGYSFATALAGWAALEAKSQAFPDRRATKTWIVTSTNPRSTHAAMNGETVDANERFSNGANYPGDYILSADESCNCRCVTRLVIY